MSDALQVVIHTRETGQSSWFLLCDGRVLSSGIHYAGEQAARGVVEKELATRGCPPLSAWGTWQRGRMTIYELETK